MLSHENDLYLGMGNHLIGISMKELEKHKCNSEDTTSLKISILHSINLARYRAELLGRAKVSAIPRCIVTCGSLIRKSNGLHQKGNEHELNVSNQLA